MTLSLFDQWMQSLPWDGWHNGLVKPREHWSEKEQWMERAFKAALAQQAHTECDDGGRAHRYCPMATMHSAHDWSDGDEDEYWCPGPKQAQPLSFAEWRATYHYADLFSKDEFAEVAWNARDWLAQQAQPEMPRGVRFRLQEMLEQAKRTFPDLLSDESIAIYREEIAWLEAALNGAAKS